MEGSRARFSVGTSFKLSLRSARWSTVATQQLLRFRPYTTGIARLVMHAQRLAEATRSRPLRRLRKDVAGIEDVHVHVLRHYAASQRHRLAMDNKLRSVVIGHADERVTNEIYTQVDEATLEAIASKIDPLASALGSV